MSYTLRSITQNSDDISQASIRSASGQLRQALNQHRCFGEQWHKLGFLNLQVAHLINIL